MDPRRVRRGALGGRGCTVSGAAPAGAARPAGVLVGCLREQPPGEVLPAHRQRPQAFEGDHRIVAAYEHGDQPRFGSDLREGPVAEWVSSLRQRVRALLRRRRLEQDLQDEMAFHLAMREAQLRASGAADAGIDARRRFGSTVRIGEELRDAWAVAPGLVGFVQDLRYALRTLRRYPGFALVVAVTLGLGIGINTATFSIVNAALITPLGFADPDRLVALQERLVGFEF